MQEPNWEAEVGGTLEPVSSRLQWAVIAPLYSSLGNSARPYLKSKTKHQPGQHGETLSLLKIQKLARSGGVQL